MSNRTYYCVCDDNCRFETMTKTQILQAISKAVNMGVVEDVQASDGVYEINNGRIIKLWVGTQQEYNEISVKDNNVLYIIDDDGSVDDLEAAFEELLHNMQTLLSKETQLQQSLLTLADTVDNIDNEVNELSGNYDDLENMVDGYEAAVAEETQKMSMAQEEVEGAQYYANIIKNGGATAKLLETTTKFDQSKGFQLSQSVNIFSRIQIQVTYEDAYVPKQSNVLEVNVSRVGSSYFVLPFMVQFANGTKKVAASCQLNNSTFYIDSVNEVFSQDFKLTIYGIL